MPDIFDHVASQGHGCIALKRNRGLIVGPTRPDNIPAGWGFVESAAATPELLRETAAVIERETR